MHSHLFLLLLCILSSYAGITDLSNLVLRQGNTLKWRFAVVSRTDAAFGSAEPHVQFKFDIDKVEETDNRPPNPEMVLFHHEMYGVQVGRKGRWCCTQALYNDGLCTEKERIIFTDKVGLGFSRVNKSDEFLTANNSMIFYWQNFLDYDYHNSTNSITVADFMPINLTGVWYLVLAHCNGSYDVTVSGQFEWKNPFGFLSGSIFAFLPLYFVLAFAFLVLLGGWAYFLVKYRNNLMGLQHATTASIAIGFVESFLWAIDYLQYNQGGKISDGINVIGALLTAGKLTVIRTLILLVALGYSITTPILDRRTKLFVLILTLAYGLCAAVNEYLWVLATMGVDVSIVVETIVLGVLSALNMAYLIWIAKNLINHFKNLEQLKQTEKLSMYRKFTLFLGGFIAISVIFFLLQFALITADLSDELWRMWWIWDGYWEIGYFMVVLLIAYLWLPNENNERYAYSVQLGADGNPLDDLNDIGIGSDSSEEQIVEDNEEDEGKGKEQDKKDKDLNAIDGSDEDL